MNINTIGIIGAGTMGSGIAQVMAVSGFEVILMDINEEFIRRGIDNIKKGLAKALEKGKITPEEKEKIKARISTTTEIEDMAKADFIIEAVSEIEELKLDIFNRLNAICRKEVILSTNTSSIPISKIASATKRQDKVIGMHFMNPAPLIKLVEIIRGKNTSDETFVVVKNLAEKIGKVPVESKDSPGFIVNRVLMPMINEAA
ncbi:MAG: 3-hydroxyacyl-CoA dehydrogenase NAD-binding domain-containing protein, partial [Nitrospinota bacterium]